MDWMLYGAYGYTGDLVAREAHRRGLRPTLAGRRRGPLEALADELGLPWMELGLDDAATLDRALAPFGLVLHCAGPFARTAAPMVEACLRQRTHYLDVTGEVEVFAAIHQRDRVAREHGVMLLPGVGFDVVPSDCLIAHVAARCPGARHLTLAFEGVGQPSRGTATTMLENIGRGGVVRRDGVLRPVPAAWKTVEVDFGRGPRRCVSIPWGDVFTAFVSTGIPDVEVLMAAPTGLRAALKLSRYLGPVLQSTPVQALLQRRIRSGPAGPTPAEREAGSSHLWARVLSDDGREATARSHGPEGYTATVGCALWIVEAARSGRHPAGFQTPSRAYGAEVARDAAGFRIEDL